jgi:hypothetical protein
VTQPIEFKGHIQTRLILHPSLSISPCMTREDALVSCGGEDGNISLWLENEGEVEALDALQGTPFLSSPPIAK